MPEESSTSVANRILGTALAVLAAFGLAALSSEGLLADAPAFLSVPGSFLAGAFSWAAAFVPLWLAAAASIAFLPGWRPGPTAALALSVLPFLPVAAIARLSSEPEPFLSEHPYLEAIGMPSLIVAALALALALAAFVVYFAKTISSLASGPTARGNGDEPAPPPLGLLPAPRESSPEPAPAAPFEFRVPELAPLPRLRALGEGDSTIDDPEELKPAVAAVAEAGSSELGIEFTSVPPLHPRPEAEEAKAAAYRRVLARRKDKPYAVPSEGILTAYPDGEYWIIDEKTKRSAVVLRETLAEFKIEAEVTGIRKGPVITMFEILPAPGVKLSKITNLADNIALRLAASSVRIVAPIPGKHAVGIEVPNERRSIVSLREIVEYDGFKTSKMEIPVILGKDISGEAQFIDLTQTPHLLIAGATGSGKSVCVNAMILSILYRRSPGEVRLLLIDPKIVELKLYNDIPHLLTPVITEPKRAFQALQYCICEMERRYSLLDHAGVRDVKSYNRKIKDKGYAAERLPYIVVIIDEFADLMATTGKELESTLARLAAMSRAVGIHLVLATQRPSIDVITGLIKANIPSRIAFMVASKFDSRIIIDMVGAEKLLGRGDMLVATAWDPFPIRMQGAFVSEEEVEKAVEFVKTLGEPEYIDDEIFIDDEDEDSEPSLFGDEDDDPLFEKALEIVLQQGKASASYIQRRLKIGYNRASRLVELMEEKGIVGPAKGSKPRDIVHNPEALGRPTPVPPRQQSLLPGIETRPGQRVTGRDEDD
jgi:DNA segregation ATPase FtsK/SpoIIIE-like protein